jgi:hypothetical protein
LRFGARAVARAVWSAARLCGYGGGHSTGVCGQASGHALQHRLALWSRFSRPGALEQYRKRLSYHGRRDADLGTSPFGGTPANAPTAVGLEGTTTGSRSAECHRDQLGLAHGSIRCTAPRSRRRNTAVRTVGPGHPCGLGRTCGLHRERHSRLRKSDHHQARRELAIRLCAQSRIASALGPRGILGRGDRPHG